MWGKYVDDGKYLVWLRSQVNNPDVVLGELSGQLNRAWPAAGVHPTSVGAVAFFCKKNPTKNHQMR